MLITMAVTNKMAIFNCIIFKVSTLKNISNFIISWTDGRNF